MLEGLKIGGIEGIGGFGGIKPNSQLTPKVPETQQYATPIETTSTPRIDAIGQPKMMSSATGGRIGGFADTSTMLDRQIEDQKKKFITPKLDFMKGFGGMDGITRPAINPAITTDKFAKGFGEEFRAEPEKFQDSFMQNLLGKQTELGQQANKLVADKFQAQQIEGRAKIDNSKKESDLVKKLMSGEIQDRELVAQEYPEFADKIDTYMDLSNNLGSIKNIKEFEKKYPDVSKKVWYDNNKKSFDKGTTIFDVEAVADSPLTQLEQEQAIQAKEAGYEMEDIQKEIAKQRTKIDIMEKAVGKKVDGLINDMGDNLGLTDVEQIRGTKEYYDELKNLYERETKSPYIEPWMKSRSMLELTDEQKEIVNDEPQMEGILRFGNIMRQGLAFGVNMGPAAINLAIFASELINDPKGTVSQFKQIPDVLSNYINDSLDNIDQKAVEGGAMGALEGILEVIDDTQMFLAENPDIILAPEAMLTKGSAIRALTKLGIDNVGEIANKIKIPVSEGDVAKTITKLDANTLNLIDKSIKPTVAGKQSAADLAKFQENVVKSVDNIIQNKDNLKFTDELGQTIEGKTPESLQQFSEAIGQTKDSIFQQYNNLAKEAGKTVDVPLDNIVKELDGIINNQLLDISAPGLRKYAESMKKTVREINKLGVEQSQQLLQQLNAKLKAFYRNPNPNDIGKNMVDVLISNNLRQGLDDSILKALGDNQYSNLKSKYGELVSIEKEVAKRALIEARRNNKSLLDFTDIFSAGDVIGGLAGGQFGLVAKGLIQKGIKEYFKFLDNPNTNIKKLFKKVEQGKIDVDSLRKAKNLEKSEKVLEKAKEVKLEKPKEGLSNLGKTMDAKTTQLKATVKAPEEALLKEAKKYKSAEEFIKSKEKVYHGTNAEFDKFDASKQNAGRLSKGDYFTTNKDGAKGFGNNIKEGYFTLDNPLKLKRDIINKDGTVSFAKSTREQIFDKFPETKNIKWEDVSDYLKKKGYDGIDNGEYKLAFDGNKIKTESQLKQIRKQANKTKGLPVKNESIPQLKATVKAPEDFSLKINKGKLGEKEVIVLNPNLSNKGLPKNEGLAGLGKTDFNKPATTGLPKSVKLSYNKSSNPNKIDITIYKGVGVKDKINTPGAGTNYSFYSNDINRAKSYTPDNNIIEKNIILDKKDVKIIDSNGINWYSKVDNNGNIIKGKERIGKNNYVNYNNDLAKKEGYKAVIYQGINDNGPHGRPSKLPKSADDIVLL